MKIETNLQGRLRNTSLPQSNGLMPVFEAVINSVHSIEESGISSEAGLIRMSIDRAPAQHRLADPNNKKPGPEPLGDIRGFAITDNGIGFNDTNFSAFMTLDTDHKASKGGRGIGRLLWLKAFESVTVESRFFVDGDAILQQRHFEFRTASGVIEKQVVAAEHGVSRETTVQLRGFKVHYRESTLKTAEAIASAMLEHCLWYFVRPGSVSRIEIEDGGELIHLQDVYESHMHSSTVREHVKLKNETLDLLHVKLRTRSSSSHKIAYCADNRLVREERLAGRIPGLYGSLSDGQGEFTYACYVNSGILNSSVRPERSSFDIPDDAGALFEGTEIGWNDIRAAVTSRIAEHLSDQLEGVKRRAQERLHDFISKRAPRYRPLLSRLSPDELNIDPDIPEKDLELALHGHLAKLETQLLTEGHDLMAPRGEESADAYRDRVRSYLQTVKDIKMSDLANYVAHRRVVLDLLAVAIQRGPDGHYSREDFIHTLIMPMRADSTEALLDNCNLWLVNERLAFHDYLASDIPLKRIPVTGSTSRKEPDLLALNVFDNPVLVSESTAVPLASIVVVELKRPMRDNAGSGEIDDPIEQALGYLDRVRNGQVRTAQGRPIPRSEDIPGFCYVICDITASIEKRCRMHDLIRTSDGLGYFAYKQSYKTYVEVVSFDKLVREAKERNRAFFDRLGLPAH